MRFHTLVGLAIACSVIGVGCSIPLQDEAHGVDDVPPDFLAPITTAPVETVPSDESSHILPLYFVDVDNNLVRVERRLTEAATVNDALLALTQHLTEAEQEENPGLDTRLLVGLETTAQPRTSEGLVVIEVADEELRLWAEAPETADRVQQVYSQIVCTLVALDERITSVQINDGDGPIPVQGQDVSVIEGPVTPANVNDCKTADDIAAEAAEAADGEETTTSEGG
ncbi:MAG: hypothetical protein GY773_12965 [Actinomycetia bacterium]|nr:hypothetical protein [Actinomycetes bacterium]MCP5032180.1 hypothetical protein [Actinomycetes bacterium]